MHTLQVHTRICFAAHIWILSEWTSSLNKSTRLMFCRVGFTDKKFLTESSFINGTSRHKLKQSTQMTLSHDHPHTIALSLFYNCSAIGKKRVQPYSIRKLAFSLLMCFIWILAYCIQPCQIKVRCKNTRSNIQILPSPNLLVKSLFNQGIKSNTTRKTRENNLPF